MFAVKVGAYLSEASLRCSTLRLAPDLAHKFYTSLEKLGCLSLSVIYTLAYYLRPRLSLEVKYSKGFHLSGFSLASKYKTRVVVTHTDKHSSLLTMQNYTTLLIPEHTFTHF